MSLRARYYNPGRLQVPSGGTYAADSSFSVFDLSTDTSVNLPSSLANPYRLLEITNRTGSNQTVGVQTAGNTIVSNGTAFTSRTIPNGATLLFLSDGNGVWYEF